MSNRIQPLASPRNQFGLIFPDEDDSCLESHPLLALRNKEVIEDKDAFLREVIGLVLNRFEHMLLPPVPPDKLHANNGRSLWPRRSDASDRIQRSGALLHSWPKEMPQFACPEPAAKLLAELSV